MSYILRVGCSSTRGKVKLLLMSDEHADNAHSDLALIRKHHQQAVDEGAAIFKFGDTFCAMEGKWDKRADANALRPEMRGNNYLDLLSKFHHELYRPYASNIAIISQGNHETSIAKHHQTDLVDRLTYNLRRDGSPVLAGGFTGFVTVRFDFGKGNSASKILHWHHGYGGGGEVTRGFIDNNRTRGQYLADIYYSGHIHRRNMDENEIVTVHQVGNVIRRQQLFLRGGAYKREDGPGGFHTERGRSARPCGGWWLDISCYRGKKGYEFEVVPAPAQ